MDPRILTYNNARRLGFNRLAGALNACNQALFTAKKAIAEWVEDLKIEEETDLDDLKAEISRVRGEVLKDVTTITAEIKVYTDKITSELEKIQQSKHYVTIDEEVSQDGVPSTSGLGGQNNHNNNHSNNKRVKSK